MQNLKRIEKLTKRYAIIFFNLKGFDIFNCIYKGGC